MQVKLGAFYSLYSKGKNSNTASPPSKSYQWKESNALEPNWVIAAETYPGFCSMKRLGVFLLPPDGMQVHRRSLPRNLLGFPNNAAVPIYAPGWREALWE